MDSSSLNSPELQQFISVRTSKTMYSFIYYVVLHTAKISKRTRCYNVIELVQIIYASTGSIQMHCLPVVWWWGLSSSALNISFMQFQEYKSKFPWWVHSLAYPNLHDGFTHWPVQWGNSIAVPYYLFYFTFKLLFTYQLLG